MWESLFMGRNCDEIEDIWRGRKQPLKKQLQRIFAESKKTHNSLILFGRGGRFEPPTPCAQGGFKLQEKNACIQLFRFQADAVSILRSVAPYRTLRNSHPHFRLHQK